MGMTLSSKDVSPARTPSKGRQRNANLIGALPFLAPALIFFGLFVVYPMIKAFQLSFLDWDGLSEQMTFVGLSNYVYIFTKDPVFWTAVRNTLIWVVLSLIIPTSLGLALAMAMNQQLAGRNGFRTIFYLPAVLAPIAVATMWRWIYNPNFGVVNYVLKIIGLGGLKQAWLGDPNIALLSIFIASTWVVTGLNMVLFLAGLQNVPKEITEAAKVDGAGPWQVFRNVTIPALQPTLVVVLALTIINSLKVFDLVVGMTGGGPAQSTQVLALWSYTQSFGNHNFGVGNAIAMVLFAVTLLIVGVLQAWYPGQECGNAIADVLFGSVNPAGRLPQTFPRRLEDNPTFINYPGENGKVRYGEGIFVGYRYYEKKRVEPLFPFGYGLSYTTFRYDTLRLSAESIAPGEKLTVTIDVTNTGTRAGQEVVQLYCRDDETRLVRPLKELKGFAKVSLEPGESRSVILVIGMRDLAAFDDTKAAWVAEAGKFEVIIGSSSHDIRAHASFTLSEDWVQPVRAE